MISASIQVFFLFVSTFIFLAFQFTKKFNVISKSICEIIFRDNFSCYKEVAEGKNYVQSLSLLTRILLL